MILKYLISRINVIYVFNSMTLNNICVTDIAKPLADFALFLHLKK